MKTIKQMKHSLAPMEPVGNSMERNMDKRESALSTALKRKRLAKAAKHRLISSNSPDDNPMAVENPTPDEE